MIQWFNKLYKLFTAGTVQIVQNELVQILSSRSGSEVSHGCSRSSWSPKVLALGIAGDVSLAQPSLCCCLGSQFRTIWL